MTETAIGAMSSSPSPMPSAIGTILMIVVSVVIRIGLIRVLPASAIASSRPMVSLFWPMNSTRRIALFTTIPMSMIRPIKDGIDSFIPARNSDRNAPDMAKGIDIMTITGKIKDSN